MKKFTIFLLTFLLFVGFINVYAQKPGEGGTAKTAHGITANYLSALYCSDPGTVGVYFQVSDGAADPLSDPMILMTFDKDLPFSDWDTLKHGDTYFHHSFDNVQFSYQGPLTQTTYFIASVHQNSAPPYDVLTSELTTIEVREKPQLELTKLIGILCEDATVNLVGTVMNWDEFNAPPTPIIDYAWSHDATQFGTSLMETATVDTIFDELAAGVHHFELALIIYDSDGKKAIGCDTTAWIDFKVYEQPTLGVEYSGAVCETDEDLEIYVYGGFEPADCNYQIVWTVYNNGVEISEASKTDTVWIGTTIGQDILLVPVSALDICENTLSVRLQINNLEYCDTDETELVNVGITGCSVDYEEMSVTKYQVLTADAGSDTGLCGDGELMLEATIPEELNDCDDTQVYWSVVGFPNATVDVLGENELTPTIAITDIYGIEVVQIELYLTNGTCESLDTVSIVAIEPPPAYLYTDSEDLIFEIPNYGEICKTAGEFNVFLTSLVDDMPMEYNCDVAVLYELFLDGEIYSSSELDTIYVGTPLPDYFDTFDLAELACGEHEIYGAITINNLNDVCGVEVDHIEYCTRTLEPFTVNVYEFIQAAVENDTLALCGNDEINLNGVDPVDEENECTADAYGEWTVNTLGFEINIEDINDPNTLVTFVDVTGTQTFEFIWTVYNGPCESADTVTVILHELPTVHLMDTSACALSDFEILAQVEYLDAPDTDGHPYTFTWEPTGIAPLNDEDLIQITDEVYSRLAIDASLPADGSITVTVKDVYGCENTDTKEVHIWELPQVNIDEWYGFCLYQEDAEIIATTTGGLPDYSYEWTGNIVGDGVDNIFTPDVTITQEGELYVTVTDEHGCSTSDTAWVSVIDPTVEILIDPIPTPVCNHNFINLNAQVFPVNGTTNLTYEWFLCPIDPMAPCQSTGITDLSGIYKLDLDDNIRQVLFRLVVHHENYSTFCDQIDESETITVLRSIKVDLVGSEIDTICHGGSVNLMYAISNYDLNLMEYPVYYRWLENGLFHEGADQIHMLQAGSTQIDFTTYPALHTSEEGPASYCYQLEIWQGAYPGEEYPQGIDPLNPAFCHTISDCHMVTVLKDPVVTISGLDIVNKGTASVEFTANVVGGAGDPIFTWYLNGIEQKDEDGNSFNGNPFILEDQTILGVIGNYDIAVKVKQTYPGCEADLVVHPFIVTCPTGTVTIEGPTAGCIGDGITLTAVVVTDATDYLITWKRDGQFVGTGLTYEFIVTEPIDMSEIYVEVSLCSCELIVAPVHYFQALPVTVALVEDYIICENGAVDVVVNHVNWDGQIYRYAWYDAIDAEEPFAITYVNHRLFTFEEMDGENVKTFYVKIEMLNAVCSSNLVEFTITVQGALEPVALLPESLITCIGTTELFTLGDDPNVELYGAHIVSWWVDGIEIPGEELDYINIPFFTVGTHYVYARISYPGNTCEVITGQVAVEVREILAVTIEGPHEVCVTENALLYAVVDPLVSETMTYSYQWYLNGVLLEGKVESSLQIEETPSAIPYIYTVIVTDEASGCVRQSLPYAVTVTELPLIAITADKLEVCVGETILLTADVPEDENMIYQWYTVVDGELLEIDGANAPAYYDNPQETTTYQFTYTQNGTNCFATSNVVTVTVVPIPVFEMETVTETICRSQQVTFTAPLIPAVTYTWLINGAPQDVVTNEFAPIFEQAGTFVVEVFVTTDIAGCTSELVYAGTVTVKNNPVVTIAGPEFVCNTQNPTVLYAVVDPSNATVTYQWYENDNSVGTNPTQNVSNIPTSVPYIYIVEITDTESGCVVKSLPHSVTVEQYPTVSITADQLVVCPETPVLLTAGVSGNNNTVYQWYANNEAIPGGNAPTLYVYPTITTVYTFIATELGSECFATSNEVLVTVIPVPVVVVATPTIETICKGEQSIFTANVTTQNPVTYTWYINNQIVEGVTGNVFTHIFDQAGIFEVTVSATTDEAGCTSEIVYAGTITVKAAPTVVIEGVHAICDAAVPPVLYAIVTPQNATVTYQWFENGTPVGTEPTQVVNTAPSAYPYVYTVLITDYESGCQVLSEPHTVYVTAYATIPVTTNTNQICIGTEITLTADVVGLTNMTFKWFMDDVIILGEYSSILYFTPPAIGVHTFRFEATQTGSECVVHSNVITIEVNPIPESPVLTISDNTICSGNPVTVSGDVAGDYTWYRNGAITDFVLQTIVDQPTANNVLTTYTYTAIVTVEGCTSELSVPVSVVVHPPINPVISGGHYVCEQALGNEHLMLHETGIQELPGVTYEYSWYYVQNGSEQVMVEGYGPDCQVPNNLPVNDPSAPYFFYVTVTAVGYDCIKTSAAFEVHILAKPVVYLTVDHPNICQNGTVTVTAHVSPGVPSNYTYNWTLNGTPLAFIDQNVITIDQNWIIGVNEIAVTVQRDYANWACTASDAINVNVLTPPSLQLTQDIAGLQLPGMCVGGQVNLYATVVDFDETLININDFIYEWRLNGTPIAVPYNFLSQVLNNPGTYNYEVRAYINSLGCATPWTAFDPVKVVPQATVSIYPKDFNYYDVCQDAVIEIDNTLVIDPVIQVGKLFCWNDLPNDCEPFTTQIDPRNVTFYTTGDHSFFLNVEFMNPTCNAIKSNTWTFKVTTNPTWTDILVDPEELCLGETVSMSAAYKGGVNTDWNVGIIQWMYSYEGGTLVPVGNVGANKTHTPTQAGDYIYYATYAPSNPLTGCHVDPYPVNVEVSASPSARFAKFNSGETLIACADNSSFDLEIQFEGKAPFKFQIMETPDGSVKSYISHTNVFMLHVTPDVTTQYKLVYLEDNSKCATSNFAEGYITVNVTNIEVVNPSIATCEKQVDVYFNIISSVSKTATIDFAGETWTKDLKKVGNQFILTIDIPETAPKGENLVLVTIDGCEYPISITLGDPVKAIFVDADHPELLQICGNDPTTTQVLLNIKLIGTPPFNYLLVGTDGTRIEMISYTDVIGVYVTPTVTTTYYIEGLSDALNCEQQYVRPEVTVTVTDVDIISLEISACGDPFDVELTLISSVAKIASVTLSSGTWSKTWTEAVAQGYNALSIAIPAGVDYGTLKGILSIDGCEYAFTVNYGGGASGNTPLIHRRWENYYDVLAVSNNYKDTESSYYNGGYVFTSYQWYKNGIMIPGATQQYYQDPNGINGIYSVKVTGYKYDTQVPFEFMTCEQEFNPTFSLKVYPVPAQVNQPVWVEVDLTPTELEGAVLDIYDAKGAHVQHINVVTNRTLVDGFKAQGTYFGRITTGTNEIKSVKFVIVN